MASNYGAILRQSRSKHPAGSSNELKDHNVSTDSSSSMALGDDVSVISSINPIFNDAISLASLSSQIQPNRYKLDQVEDKNEINFLINPHEHLDSTLARMNETCDRLFEEIDKTMKHLKDCSLDITTASNECLKSLSSCVNLNCSRIDEGTKASYQLIATCDNISKELSTVSKFSDEIKQLKKGVENLEVLYLASK